MKNIFITGASRGIGLELSKQYLELGYSVTATCRNPNGATSLRKIKDEYPLKLEILSMDVESEDSVKSCLSSLYRKNKIIDILYNNAGIIDWRDINDVEADSI